MRTFALVVLVACGSPAQSPNPDATSVDSSGSAGTIDDFPAAAARAYCTVSLRCCPDPEETEGECEQEGSQNAQTGLAQLKADIAAGTLAYDGVKADACFAEIATLTCTDFSAYAYSRALLRLPDCEAIFVGKIAAGSTCTDQYACANHGFCSSASNTCTSVSNIGDTCEGYCYGELYCDSATKTCAPLKANGAVCDDDSECSGGACQVGSCAVIPPSC